MVLKLCKFPLILKYFVEFGASCYWDPHRGPLTRYVILRVAHAPGIPATFSQLFGDPVMHHGTCVRHMMHVRIANPKSRQRGKRSRRSRYCSTRSFTYLARGPCGQMADYIISADELGHNLTWTLQWRHYRRDAVSNHQPHHCLLNRLSRQRSKKAPKLRVTAFGRGIHRSPVNSLHKWPVTLKMFPFDEVIMVSKITEWISNHTHCFM